MKSKLELQIEHGLNPFRVLKLRTLNSKEEMAQITESMDDILTAQEILTLSEKCISADYSSELDFIVINESYLTELTRLLSKCQIKFEYADIVNDLWNCKSVKEEFLRFFGEEDPNPELTQESFPGLQTNYDIVKDILNVIVESKYTLDDVLSKINDKGVEYLNELNLYILEKNK